MNPFRLLLVEDSEEDIAAWYATVERYADEKKRQTCLVVCKNVDEALATLDSSFDGAVIDLKLDNEEDGGNRIFEHIRGLHARIPVAILTGTPSPVKISSAYMGLFIKGTVDGEYDNILDRFWDIYNTGITRIMGGRGKIGEILDQVFRTYMMNNKYREKWIKYAKQCGEDYSSLTERALLRHTLNHLLRLLGDEEEPCFPEEFYLIPPIVPSVRTGSIVKKKGNENIDQKFVIMNPACDLVLRERKNDKTEAEKRPKTERILIVEIEPIEKLLPSNIFINPSKTKQRELENVLRNNTHPYYHCLPPTEFFEGGALNFRKLSTYSWEEFQSEFKSDEIEISPSFVKDIVARFSTYYARQGQPDIGHHYLIDSVETKDSD